MMSVPVLPRVSQPLIDQPGWPLAVLFLGFPLWYLLGLSVIMFYLVAIPMAWFLWRRRKEIVIPSGFNIWVIFLVVVVLSGFMLGVNAPFAVEGFGLPGSLLTYGVRLVWYVTATIVFLYIVNIPEKDLTFRRVSRWLAFMFVVTTIGGLIGLLFPDIDMLSVLGQLLPGGLASNAFVGEFVRIDVADIQNILGFEEVRPKAPFPYANSWGANLSMFLPFFVYSWIIVGRRWERILAPFVLVGAATGIVFSLNRTLWGALAAGAVYGIVQLVRLRPRLLPLMLIGAAVVVLAFFASGLNSIVTARLDNPHSDERRGELAGKSWQAVAEASPVLGFGNIRDVQGSFASIAGGETPSCPGCSVPPFGTQGQFWLVLYAQGLAGVLFFCGFILYRMARHLKTRDGPSIAMFAAMIFFIIELPFYDLLGPPLFTGMLALGLLWRRRAQEHGYPDPAEVSELDRSSVSAAVPGGLTHG